MKRSKAYQAMIDDLAHDFRVAPIEERNFQYRDEFSRHYHKVGVELCHGQWHTFSRYGSSSDPHVTAHPSREAARAHALKVLGL